MDELITSREVGYNSAALRPDYERYESLPAWAQTTLAKHAGDRREHVYDLETLESAKTYDEVWNATQNELLREGRMHNYLRMLWGKKVLEWSETPRQALETLLHLNNKYALDGRNPNSTSGIFWVFGRYDGARDLRYGALHDQPEHAAEATDARLHGDLRTVTSCSGLSTQRSVHEQPRRR